MQLIKTTPYEDLCALPKRLIGEIIEGQLYAHPRPSSRHAAAGSAIGGQIINPYQFGNGGPGGWWILDEPEVHLADGLHVVVPDLAGWRKSTLPSIPDGYIKIKPDWVCEIASPSTQSYDEQVKMPLYASVGVEYLWLVHPLERWVDVYVLESGTYMLVERKSGGHLSAVPFEDTLVNLDHVFP